MVRFFSFTLVLFFTQLSLAGFNPIDLDRAQVVDGKVLVEANDSGEKVYITPDEYGALTGEEFLGDLTQLVDFFNFKKSFSTVASFITPTLEDEFDVFIMINVDYESRYNSAHFIPAQHMRVLKKDYQGQIVFQRDENGSVVDVDRSVLGAGEVGALPELSGLMPVSSGAGHFIPNPDNPDDFEYVDTPTGIYRINHAKSTAQRYGKGMWNSLYFDLIYSGGRQSGLAMHGTKTTAYQLLGRQRSHGCIRTTQEQALSLYENILLNVDMTTVDLPDMDRKKRLKSEAFDENGVMKTRSGQKALIIIFYGYDLSLEVEDA